MKFEWLDRGKFKALSDRVKTKAKYNKASKLRSSLHLIVILLMSLVLSLFSRLPPGVTLLASD